MRGEIHFPPAIRLSVTGAGRFQNPAQMPRSLFFIVHTSLSAVTIATGGRRGKEVLAEVR
ncbi:hypothetical protein JOC24_006331 [Streptomyces sp. HB132]|nr:hypothetical protein [Streptomyces sp. HB132]